ncbi:MAG: tyrosine--tRNA ligase [candidate division FCPU426 bacterium]
MTNEDNVSHSQIISQLRQGTAEVIGEEALLAKLQRGVPLRVKYGADPSAPDLHLGHTVVLRKLRQFQNLGHTVQFLIGDFTGMIGDPTGRSVTRPPLTPEQIQANARTYQEQVFKILLPEKTEVVFNSTWCQPMGFSDVIRLASQYTVARILERDDFQLRYRDGRPIGLHELLYPLIQGYDSVVLKSDVELCGTDQIFNCLVARDLQQAAGQEPEVIIAMPLLEGLDGVQKMSKSLGNYIGLTDAPGDMYGKVMSLPDALMMKYFELLTDVDIPTLQQWLQAWETGKIHPRDLKARLASSLVTQYHGEAAAKEAGEQFDRVFKNNELPQDIPEKNLPVRSLKDGQIWIVPLLHTLGLVASKSEAQRMVQQGAVQVNQKRIDNVSENILIEDGMVLQVGKRKFVKIKLISS